MLSDLPRQIRFPSQTSLAQHTRDCHEYLRALVPEAREVSTTWNETSPGAIKLMNPNATPYFSLLVYLASNNLLKHAALEFMLDYAENLITQRQFKSVFSAPEPSIRALLDTLLSSAVRARNMAVIKAALSAGAYPNVRVENDSALEWSASKGDTEVMERLLDAGADPHASALHQAAQSGCVEAVKLLLEVGGTRKYEAESALYTAIRGRKTKICWMILDANTGLDLNRGIDSSHRITLLQHAVQVEYLEIIELLLKFGANLNAPAETTSGITALQAAVEKCNIPITRYLLDLGANINQKASEHGKTAIQYALQNNNEELFILLLEAGADINVPAKGYGGSTALQLAAEKSDIDLIKLLLEAGADVNAPAAPLRGMTALQAASKMGRRDVVELLLNHGADINAPATPKSGMTALQAAAKTGDVDLVRILLEAGGDILAPATENGATVLESAIEYDENDLQNILSGEVEVHEFARESRIPFEMVQDAWHRRDFPFVRVMLGLFAGLDIRSLCDGNALGSAAKRLHDTNIDLVEFLLGTGVAVDSRKDISSPTALHLAVLHHDFPVVRTLLKAGADIHLLWCGESIIQTALEHWDDHFASRARIILDAWRLLEKAIDIDRVSPKLPVLEFQDMHDEDEDEIRVEIRTCEDLLKLVREEVTIESKKKARGALAVAAAQWRQGSVVLVQIFLGAGADPNIGGDTSTPLQRAARIGSATLVRSLLNAKADVNAASPQITGTALQEAIASRYFNLEIVHLLLDNGADVNAPAPDGYFTRTALQAAIEKSNNMELIQLLLDRGADVNAPACQHGGVTALQAAAIKGYVGLAAQLLEAGADVNAPGPEEGRTALEGAAEWGRLDMVQLLLNAGAGYDASGALSYEMALGFAKDEGFMAVHDLIKAHFDNKLKSDESTAAWGASNVDWNINGMEWDMSNTEWNMYSEEWNKSNGTWE